MASPSRVICSHSCSPDGGAHFRYSPRGVEMRSASWATRLASAARSSPDVMLKPMAENWLGMSRLLKAAILYIWSSF